jgi:hypothetical protein
MIYLKRAAEEDNVVQEDARIAFLHTGGSLALYYYPDTFGPPSY